MEETYDATSVIKNLIRENEELDNKIGELKVELDCAHYSLDSNEEEIDDLNKEIETLRKRLMDSKRDNRVNRDKLRHENHILKLEFKKYGFSLPNSTQ